MADDLQGADFKWFTESMPDLYEKYGRCFLAISNREVLGAYGTYADGVRGAAEKMPLGSFIVQRCDDGPDAYTDYIASMGFMETAGVRL